MEYFLAILALIVFFGGYFLLRYLLSKGTNAVAKSANKHILFRPEYQAERQLISEALTFETKASVDEIMQQLTAYVSPEVTVPKVKIAFYELSRSADHVAYVYGSHLTEMFVATVSFKKSGEMTQGVFKFLRWKEKEGMLMSAEAMKMLRKKVWSAFSAADPSVRVIGTPANNS